MKRVVFLGLSVLFSPVLFAQTFTCPSWSIATWWDIDSSFDVVISGALPAELTFHEVDCRVIVSGIETKALTHGSHAFHEVYILRYSGLLNGEGSIRYDGGPFPFFFQVRIPDTTVTGEIWIDTQTLSLVAWSRDLTGRLESIQGTSWEDIGEIRMSATIEYDPKWDPYTFPVTVNDNWFGTADVYTFGHYRIALELFSPDVIDEQSYDGDASEEYTAVAAEIETIDDVETVRIDMQFDSGADSVIWYAPDLGWNKRFESSGMENDSIFDLTAFSYDTGEFGDTPATPQPTRTPIPPTVTPTARPTTPHTPTPTGTQPTPTATYTLPPWIPKTPTPTPTPPASPTATSTPDPNAIRIQIGTNQPVFSQGDSFVLLTTITNPLSTVFAMEYIILEYEGMVWFWPEWVPEINGQFRIIPGDSQFKDETILEFVCPPIESPITGVRFWAVLTEPGSYDVLGEYGSCSVRFE